MHRQPVTPSKALPKVLVVPRDDKPVHQLLETQVQKISALEEQVRCIAMRVTLNHLSPCQIRGNNEMVQHMKDYHEELMEGLRTQYAKMMEGVQAQQATLQEHLMESERRAFETNENARLIQAEADERAARAEERAKQYFDHLQTRRPGVESRVGSSAAGMSEQGFAQAESNAMNRRGSGIMA